MLSAFASGSTCFATRIYLPLSGNAAGLVAFHSCGHLLLLLITVLYPARSSLRYISGMQAEGESPSEALSELRRVSWRRQHQRSSSQVPPALNRPQEGHWLQCGRTYSKGQVLEDGTWVGTDIKCGKWRRCVTMMGSFQCAHME
jgi:hypothetical protein